MFSFRAQMPLGRAGAPAGIAALTGFFRARGSVSPRFEAGTLIDEASSTAFLLRGRAAPQARRARGGDRGGRFQDMIGQPSLLDVLPERPASASRVADASLPQLNLGLT